MRTEETRPFYIFLFFAHSLTSVLSILEYNPDKIHGLLKLLPLISSKGKLKRQFVATVYALLEVILYYCLSSYPPPLP